jgi:arylsulfatase A-like enzyme
LVAVPVLTLSAGDGPCGAAERPNVLFLFTDDQRADTIGALGNRVIKTPHLDALVKRGFVFRNAYCMGSTMPAVCNPSRHMVLSGMSLYRYDPKRTADTFADVMNRAGYVSWHIGKRGNTPLTYHKVFRHSSYLNDGQERTSGQHGRAAVDAALDFLKAGWDRKSPLFMYVAFEGPHDPRVAAPEWMKLYDRDALPLPANFLALHPFNNGELLVRDERLAPWPRSPDTVRRHLHDYYACISSIDHNIGRLLAGLRELGELERTVVVFSSDHGLALGGHGLFGKQNLYEHSAKAPLVFAGPGVPVGSSDALAYLFDIFPTVVELSGGKPPAGLDGRSLAPVIRGQAGGVRDAVLLAYRDVQRAVRKGDLKLMMYPKVGITRLFNLRDDPDERRDLAGDPAHAATVREMTALLVNLQKQYGDSAPLKVEPLLPAAVDESFFNDAVKTKK